MLRCALGSQLSTTRRGRYEYARNPSGGSGRGSVVAFTKAWLRLTRPVESKGWIR
jgi:hypothetical protein